MLKKSLPPQIIGTKSQLLFLNSQLSLIANLSLLIIQSENHGFQLWQSQALMLL